MPNAPEKVFLLYKVTKPIYQPFKLSKSFTVTILTCLKTMGK